MKSPHRFALVVAVAVWSFVAMPVQADMMDITVGAGRLGQSNVNIANPKFDKIFKGQKPEDVTVQLFVYKGKDHFEVVSAKKKLNADGTYQSPDIDMTGVTSFTLVITANEGKPNQLSQRFKGIPRNRGTTKGFVSDLEETSKDDLEDAHAFLERMPGGSPFTPSFSFPYSDTGGLFTQFELINTDPTFPYQFTSVVAYGDLDLAFFNPSLFDSPSAIATGTQILSVSDLVIPIAATGIDPFLTFTGGPVSPSGYELLVATARPLFDDGSLGAPLTISFASAAFAAVPEPGTGWLLAVGLLIVGLGGAVRRRGNGGREQNIKV